MAELSTPRSLQEAIHQNPERFIDNAFRENPNIQNLVDFKDALFSAFNTDRGQNASQFFNDFETIFLFKQSENRIRKNISEKEADEMFAEIKRGEFEVERGLPKGEKIKSSQVKVIYTEKKISKPQYFRHGKPVRAYSSGYRKWQTSEIKFIKVRKNKGMMLKMIVADYNKHFRNSQRTTSSVKTRIYRA